MPRSDLTQNNFPKWLHLLSPKGVSTRGATEWQGTVQAIRSENQALEKRTRSEIAKMSRQIFNEVHSLQSHMENSVRHDNAELKMALREMEVSLKSLVRLQVATLGEAILQSLHQPGVDPGNFGAFPPPPSTPLWQREGSDGSHVDAAQRPGASPTPVLVLEEPAPSPHEEV